MTRIWRQTDITAAVPGTSIKIVGTNFGTSGSVTFNGISATPSAWSSSSLTVPVPTAPSYPNTGPVRVTVSNQTATGPNFTINAPPPPPPTISGYTDLDTNQLRNFWPQHQDRGHQPGDLRHHYLQRDQHHGDRMSSSSMAPCRCRRSTSYPNTGPVRVTVSGETATGPDFTINAPPPPPPAISGYTDLSDTGITAAIIGTSIKIVGTNLGTSGAVTFNGISAVPSSWTSTVITVPVPAAPSYPNTGPVRVTVSNQTATGSDSTINAPPPPPAPTISGYSDRPAIVSAATPGTSIKIIGDNFGTGGTVSFNGISATPSAWTHTVITVPVPTAVSYTRTRGR